MGLREVTAEFKPLSLEAPAQMPLWEQAARRVLHLLV